MEVNGFMAFEFVQSKVAFSVMSISFLAGC